jgi:hypothetical protein
MAASKILPMGWSLFSVNLICLVFSNSPNFIESRSGFDLQPKTLKMKPITKKYIAFTKPIRLNRGNLFFIAELIGCHHGLSNFLLRIREGCNILRFFNFKQNHAISWFSNNRIAFVRESNAVNIPKDHSRGINGNKNQLRHRKNRNT